MNLQTLFDNASPKDEVQPHLTLSGLPGTTHFLEIRFSSAG